MEQLKNSFILGQETSFVKFETPTIPKEKGIEGYKLPKHEQKFIRWKFPKDREFNLLSDSEQLSTIKYVLQKRKDGHWFYNNGVPTFITGVHWFYLTFWQLDVGYADYRASDRDKFYFWDYCVKDETCYGMINMENRRGGKTEQANCMIYEYISRTERADAGIQSKTNTDAKVVFLKLTRAWKRIPQWLNPIDEGDTQPKAALRFFEPSKRSSKNKDKSYGVALDSMIDYGTAKDEHYDGKKLHRYFRDEVGKCFGLGTKIRMYDGSVKNVENISNGEFVMGNDSTKRIVSGITSGAEEMFKIIPNKGDSWECNKSHILSLIWCMNRDDKDFKKKQVVNISVDDFLKLPKWKQKHLMLYKAPVQYRTKEHKIDPYFLGIWLGDGSSCQTEITTTNIEVIEYLKDLANKEGLNITNRNSIQFALSCERSKAIEGFIDGENYKFSSAREASNYFGVKGSFKQTSIYKNNIWVENNKTKNRLLSSLQDCNLINNKHIPKEFLIDSRENRLHLLAGLIDSDGSLSLKNNKPSSFEITQKRKILAHQIQELAISLGFYASVNNKIASMKREDGSYYKCEVYRVVIYGDLFEIPTKVKYKQAEKTEFHVNRRNPLHCGFSIKSIGNGNYYGFAVDKNHLFLLEDGTVVHNTTEGDVYESWHIVKECLVQGQNIIGKAVLSTTVEEMEKKGGKNFKKLWDSSDNSNRDANGRTITGLLPYFKPAWYCLEGFIDIYGNPVTETPEKPVVGIDGKLITIGSKQYLDNKRASLSGSALASEKRKYPFESDEAFGVIYANIWEQDVIEIINRAEKEAKINPSQIQYVKMFEFDGKVETNPCKENDDVVKILEPIQDGCKYTLGIDSIGTDNETGSEDGSRIAAVLTKGFGGMESMSFAPTLTYSERPDKLESAYEKIALIVKYVAQHGGVLQVVGELNAGGTNLLNYLINRGLRKHMMKRPKSLGTSFEGTDGKYWIYRDEHVKSFQILLANRFIRRYGHNLKIKSLVLSLQMFGKQNADEADAFLVSLLGFTDFDKPLATEKKKTEVWFSRWDGTKMVWVKR